jgi:hypothetical protein
LLPGSLGGFNFDEAINVHFAILITPLAGRINSDKHGATLVLGTNTEGILGYFDGNGAIDVLAPLGCDEQALFKVLKVI